MKSELLERGFELPAAGFVSKVTSWNVDLSFPLQDSHSKWIPNSRLELKMAVWGFKWASGASNSRLEL